MRIMGVIVLVAACTEGGAPVVEPCQDGNPGLHVRLHLHLPEAYGPVDFGVGYANQTAGSLAPYLPPPPWTGDVEVRAPFVLYEDFAAPASGPANVWFGARPDPPIWGYTTLDIDLRRCNEVDVDVYQAFIDAGPDGTP